PPPRRVAEWGSAPLPAGAVQGGAVVDREAVAEATFGLLESLRSSRGRLVASVTGQRSVPRLLEFPKMEPRLIAEAVEREMKRELPVPLDETYISSQTIGGENGRIKVFALGLPKDVLDPFVGAIGLLGMRLHAADIKPLALVRAVARADTLIVDVERGSIDVIVVREGVPVTIRTVGLGGPQDGLQDVVGRAGEELARTVKFYRDTHGEHALSPDTPLSVTGSLAREVTETAQASTGLTAAPISVPMTCPANFDAAPYMVNIGLALKEV
ncbi:MAG: hypothetical protein WD939_06365, partial [Dehalococcoidia bacterium]